VNTEVEDVRVIVESGLRSVAVVDVPIDDQDLREAVLFLHVTGADGDIVEDAESHSVVSQGVVPRGPDGAERVARLALDNGIDGGENAARSDKRRVIRLAGNGHVGGIEIQQSVLAGGAGTLDILGRVDSMGAGAGLGWRSSG